MRLRDKAQTFTPAYALCLHLIATTVLYYSTFFLVNQHSDYPVDYRSGLASILIPSVAVWPFQPHFRRPPKEVQDFNDNAYCDKY